MVEFVFHEAGAYPNVGLDAIPEFAMGVPERERRRIAAQTAPGQRIEVLAVELPPSHVGPRPAGTRGSHH